MYEIDNLQVKSSQFGTSYCLQGSSMAVRLVGDPYSDTETSAIKEVQYAPGIQGAHIQTMRAAIRNAKEIVPEVTDSCAKCESDCSPRGMADKIARTSKYTFKAS